MFEKLKLFFLFKLDFQNLISWEIHNLIRKNYIDFEREQLELNTATVRNAGGVCTPVNI